MSNREAPKAHQLYRERFSRDSLKRAYQERISTSRSVGTDGIRQEAFAANLDNEIDLILRKVHACTYRFTTYKQKLISKGAHRLPRPLSIPTLRDRLTLRVLNDLITEVFRDARLWRPHVFIKNIRTALLSHAEGLSFVRIDIENFYPTIDHQKMLRKLRQQVRKPQLVHLVHAAILNATSGTTPTGCGIPQGLSISNILASIYLHSVDLKFRGKYLYFRYVDDILVICEANSANAIFDEITKELKKLGLSSHTLGRTGKSQITSVESGIEYLGFHLTPSKISVRESSYARMIANLLAVLTDYKHLPKRTRNEDRFVWRLNLKITGCIYNETRYGWLFFFSQIDNLPQLGRLDSFVTSQLIKRELGHLRPKVKNFLRSYHEIRLNLRNTKYIPKFDDFDIDDIIRELSKAEGRSENDIRTSFTEAEIKQKFTRLIERQTRSLEKDLIEAFS